MNKWQTNNSNTILETPFFNVIKDNVIDFTGKVRDYFRVNSVISSSVIVVAVKIIDGKTTFIMVEQYRHPTGLRLLECPAGRMEHGEAPEQSARRELLEETGYEVRNIRYMGQLFASAYRSSDKQHIFFAEVGNNIGSRRDAGEEGSELKVVELSSEAIHDKIKNNEIVSGCSIAAISLVMLNSNNANKYLEIL